MIGREHGYATRLEWTGNRGEGTRGYRVYERSFALSGEGKPTIEGSSDRAFRGDSTKWNPEEMLLAALSSCHMLAYLHCCADAGVSVVAYSDAAEGCMELLGDGSGHFTRVVLRPRVTLAETADFVLAGELHDKAHELCFIANSVNFSVLCEPEIVHAHTPVKDVDHA